MTSAARPPVGLYVHIPFCVSVCPYCDFVVVAGARARGPRNQVERLVRALLVEIDLRADGLDAQFGAPGLGPDQRPPLETVYFGGGTPSLLPAEQLARIIDRIRSRFGLADGAEISLEANPGPGERGSAVEQRAAGITRISFGAQSMFDDELPRLGRRHRAADVVEAVALARAAAIDSINVDVLYDIPGQTLDTWAASLGRARALETDHLSLYALTLDDPSAEGLTGPLGDHLPESSGARRWRDRARPSQDNERAAAMYELASQQLARDGFRGYELSNWARPGHACRHNLAYWQRRPVEAVGPGAHAFNGSTRRWNAARLDAYLAALAPIGDSPPDLPPGGQEPPLDGVDEEAEAIMLALRLDTGVVRTKLERPPFADALGWAAKLDLLEPAPDHHVRLTTRGRLLSNEVFARLL